MMAHSPEGAGSSDGTGGDTARDSPDGYPVTQSFSAGQATPPHPPTEVSSPHPPTEVSPPRPASEAASTHPPTEPSSPHQPTVTGRFGPGVPASSPAGPAGSTAEQVWRTGQLPVTPRRRRPLRRLASTALTVILLAAAAVVLYLRFHHSPLHVTGVAITRQVTNGCAVDVTGRIATNGSAGTVSYQWMFQPQPSAPQPLSQSVTAGQNAVFVTVAVQGQGHGSNPEDVTLQVLGPGTGSASVHVVVSC